MNISVALAAYNGEKYIKEQIDSILPQLKEGDELVVSVNPSNDRTEEIIKEYEAGNTKVKAFLCSKIGVLNNFENAISKCSNDIIFLSDQDDVWVEDKITKIMKYFDEDVVAVVHRCYYTDDHLNIYADNAKTEKTKTVRPINILWKNQVQGSCLAFRRTLLSNILPFPPDIPMHDSWIGMILSRSGKVLLVPDRLILYRQHGQNVTSRKHGSINRMIRQRICLLKEYLKR